MPEFLNLLPPTEALKVLISNLPPYQPNEETVDLGEAFGRVLALPVIAHEPLPAFNRSTVDGYAVRAADTYGSSDSLPSYLSISGEVPMGGSPLFTVKPNDAATIHTGGMLPQGADAVVMVEYTQMTQPEEVEVFRPVAPGENVLKVGEDVSVGQEVIHEGIRLRSPEIGGLAALGMTAVRVVRSPRVGIISTGDEIVPPHEFPQPGQVRDINTYTLSTLIRRVGGTPISYGIISDDIDLLSRGLSNALSECDTVIITAGSSASMRDLTAMAIERQGKPGVLVHGVNVRPGKPTILAVCNGKAVIGLPGNPVSAFVVAGLFVLPVIDLLSGVRPGLRQTPIPARLTLNLASQAGREDWIPVRLIHTSQGLSADPIFYKSNLIFSLVQADGLIHISGNQTGLSSGEMVEVTLL
jgi:molybdopterin molybdotransferase